MRAKNSWLWVLLGALVLSGGVVTYKATRGLRNNNPGNIRDNGTAWQGMTGVDADGFCIFDTPANGVRAMGHILMSYSRRGLNTVSDIISSWSATDQVPYIANVSKALGVDPDAEIDVQSSIPELVGAIIKQENSINPYNASDLISWAYS